ncbi:hypothetical protein GKZ68_10515 [Hymenobacter sp. BRD128]|uniref:hypothetical protein n=1 Tax=Hymenobacter sp. BRD128 TaxID=2675878 RepID=UPI00156336F3|nr:hypothetical protein [Hymenobacter sp. BRD128]QKG57022.1 hypothetical protein GKZ68_10515 [Hymenobacter sp. BRD128]
MKKLTFYSWQVCAHQEVFTLLLCKLAALGVARARVVVQRVLAKRPVMLELPDRVAAELRAQAEAIGIECGYD